MRSRVLLSLKDGNDENEFGPHPPNNFKGFMSSWLSSTKSSCYEAFSKFIMVPPAPDADASVSRMDEHGDQQVVLSPSTPNKNITGAVTTTTSAINNATA